MTEKSRLDVISAMAARATETVAKAINSGPAIQDSIPSDRTDGIERQLGSADGIVLNGGLKLRVVVSRAQTADGNNEIAEAQIFAPQGNYVFEGKSLSVANQPAEQKDWFRVPIPDSRNFVLAGTIDKQLGAIKFKEFSDLTIEEIVNTLKPIVLYKIGNTENRPIGSATIVVAPFLQSEDGIWTDVRECDLVYDLEYLVKKTLGPKHNVLVSFHGKKARLNEIYHAVDVLSRFCDSLVIILMGHGGMIGPDIGADYLLARDRVIVTPSGELELDWNVTQADADLFYVAEKVPGKKELYTGSFLVWDHEGKQGRSLFPTELILRCQQVNKRIILITDMCMAGIDLWLKDPRTANLLEKRKFPAILALVGNRGDRTCMVSDSGSYYMRGLLERIREAPKEKPYTYYDAAYDRGLKETLDEFVNERIDKQLKKIKDPEEEKERVEELERQRSDIPYPQVGLVPKDKSIIFSFQVPFFKE